MDEKATVEMGPIRCIWTCPDEINHEIDELFERMQLEYYIMPDGLLHFNEAGEEIPREPQPRLLWQVHRCKRCGLLWTDDAVKVGKKTT